MKTIENHKIFRSDPYVVFGPPKKKISRALRTISYCSSFDLFINETSGKAILFFLVNSMTKFENYRLQSKSINFHTILYHWYAPDALKCAFIAI